MSHYRPPGRMLAAPDPWPTGVVDARQREAVKRARRSLPSLVGDDVTRKSARRAIGKRAGGPQGIRAELLRRRVRKDLATFVREAWHVLEPGTPLIWNWHIDVICDVLMRVTAGDLQRVLITVPPGHMKSWLVSVAWPAWEWLTDPTNRSQFFTYVQSLSNEHSGKCLTLVTSEWYADQIPKHYGPRWDRRWDLAKAGVEEFKTELGGVRRAMSFAGSATGFRGRKLIIDDPLNVKEHPTDDALDDVISTYDKSLSSRFDDVDTGAIVIIMQRIHENDLAGHVIEQDRKYGKVPGWKPFTHVCLRSEYDPDHPNEFDPRTERGELLFEAKFPRHVIEAAKIQLGIAQYAAQHSQDPIPAGGGIFNTWKLAFWLPPGVALPAHHEKDAAGNTVPCLSITLPLDFDVEALSWDMSFKDLKSSDFVCGQAWGRKRAKLFLLEQVHGRLSFTRTVEEVRAMAFRRRRAVAKYVEDAANGPAVVNHLKEEIFGLIPVPTGGGKVPRFHAISPFIDAGNVVLPHPMLPGCEWVGSLLAELRAAPRGKHDDQADALAHAVQQLSTNDANFIAAMVTM